MSDTDNLHASTVVEAQNQSIKLAEGHRCGWGEDPSFKLFSMMQQPICFSFKPFPIMQ